MGSALCAATCRSATRILASWQSAAAARGKSLKRQKQAIFRGSNLEAFHNMTFETFKVQGRLGLGDQQLRSLAIRL